MFLVCHSCQRTKVIDKQLATHFLHDENLLEFKHHKIAFKGCGIINFDYTLIISVRFKLGSRRPNLIKLFLADRFIASNSSRRPNSIQIASIIFVQFKDQLIGSRN